MTINMHLDLAWSIQFLNVKTAELISGVTWRWSLLPWEWTEQYGKLRSVEKLRVQIWFGLSRNNSICTELKKPSIEHVHLPVVCMNNDYLIFEKRCSWSYSSVFQRQTMWWSSERNPRYYSSVCECVHQDHTITYNCILVCTNTTKTCWNGMQDPFHYSE